MKLEIWMLDYYWLDGKLIKIEKVRKGNWIEFMSYSSTIRHENGYKITTDFQAWHTDLFEHFAYSRYIVEPENLFSNI